MTEAHLLTVEDLRVDFETPKGVVQAVRGASFQVGREKDAVARPEFAGRPGEGAPTAAVPSSVQGDLDPCEAALGVRPASL